MSEKKFYTNAARYWANVPPTVDGILCGFGNISHVDIDGSRVFLHEVLEFPRPPGNKLALDCGAGIGRVTNSLLVQHFEKVDLVEQDDRFINTAKQLIDNSKLGTLYKIGLQNFKPQKSYDVIWCQWVLGHLTDFDLIAFLTRCSQSLNENGVIIVKENITATDEIEYDDEDSSVTRPLKLMQTIFNEATLKIAKYNVQTDFPDDIYPVYMFALVPNSKVSIV